MSKTIYELILHREAEREIRRLPGTIKPRIIKAIDGLAQEPQPPGARPLHGRKGAYRIRVADYRIVYEIHVTEVVVYIVGVAHRKEVYRRMLRRR